MALIAEKLGLPLMPWQKQVVDVALEIDPESGRLAFREVVVTVPRQAGKTTLLLAVMAWRALKWPAQRIAYTAQSGKDARLKWEDDQVPILERSPFGDLFRVRKTNGSEAIRWNNGSLHTVISPTDTAGHGTQCDLGVVDEAFHLSDHRLEQGLKPAMVTRDQPQLWVISTAGTSSSNYLKSKVDRGRDAVRDEVSSGIAYFEWSADPAARPDDPATWWSCIPSLGHTVTEDTIAGEQRSMEPSEFSRAFLNLWSAHAFASKIPARSWEACESDTPPNVDDVVFAIDVTPDRSSGSIVASDGMTFELADYGPGTDWIVSRCVNLWDRYRPRAFIMDGVGPAAAMVPDLEAAGVRVVITSSGDYASACGRFHDLIVNRKIRHTNQPEMNAAVAGAATRKLGDRWAWSRSTSAEAGVDISPLVAATLSVWGATTIERTAEAEAAPVFAY